MALMRPSKRQLLRAVARSTGVSENALQNGSLVRRVCRARHIGMNAAYLTGYTFQEAAEAFGRVDHGTAMHAIKRVKESLPATLLLGEVLLLLGWKA